MAMLSQVVFGVLVVLVLASLFVFYLPGQIALSPSARNANNYSFTSLAKFSIFSPESWGYSSDVMDYDDDDYYYYDDDGANRTNAELIHEYEHGQEEPQEVVDAVNKESDSEQNSYSDASWKQMMEQRFARRLATLKETCHKYRGKVETDIQRTISRRLYYSKNYHLMVCAVAKVSHHCHFCVSVKNLS